MIEIEIPLTKTTSPRTPNRKEHWSKSHALNKRLGSIIKLAFLANRNDIEARKMIEPSPTSLLINDALQSEIKAIVTITFIHPRQFDQDNLVASMKAVIDAIAAIFHPEAAAGHADSDKRLEWQIKQEKGQPKQYALKIKIEPKLAKYELVSEFGDCSNQLLDRLYEKKSDAWPTFFRHSEV